MHANIDLPLCLADAFAGFERAADAEDILKTLSAAAYKVCQCDAVTLHRRGGLASDICAMHHAVSNHWTIQPLSAPATESLTSADGPAASSQLTCPSVARGGEDIVSIPLSPASGCAAIDFIWSGSQPREPWIVDALRGLTSAAGLALQVRQGVDRAQVERVVYQHRIRNVLAVVRSIVRRTMLSATSAEEFGLDLEARIATLTRTQSTLNAVGDSGVEVEDLLRAELQANAVREDQFFIAGPPIRLWPKAAETMALAFHELATNSLKFGSFAQRERGAKTHIYWRLVATDKPLRLQFFWEELGVRIASLAPRHRGFGQELIERTLPYELDAQTQFDLTVGGLRCIVDMPLQPPAEPFAAAYDDDVTPHL